MIQIIRENRPDSFGQKFSNAVGAGLQGGAQLMQQNEAKQKNAQANQMASELLGFDTSGMDPKTRDQLIMQSFKQQGDLNLQSNKYQQDAQALQGKNDKENQEKLGPLQGALDSITRMGAIRKRGNLGRGSHVKSYFGGDTAKDRGEYEQLGKSLISYATNIPIRNRIEFETLAERLYDSTVTDAEAEGILKSMKSIINNSMSAYGGNPQKQSGSVGQQNRPPLTQFVGK